MFEYDLDGGGIRRALLTNDDFLRLRRFIDDELPDGVGATYSQSEVRALSSQEDANHPYSTLLRFATLNRHEKIHHVQLLGTGVGAFLHHCRGVMLDQSIHHVLDGNTTPLISAGEEEREYFLEAAHDYFLAYDPQNAPSQIPLSRQIALRNQEFDSALDGLIQEYPKLQAFVEGDGLTPKWNGLNISGGHLFEALAPFEEYSWFQQYEKTAPSFDRMSYLYGEDFERQIYGVAWSIYRHFGGPENFIFKHDSTQTHLHALVPQIGFIWCLQLALSAPLYPWEFDGPMSPELYPDLDLRQSISDREWKEQYWEAIHPGWRFVILCACMERAGWYVLLQDVPSDPFNSAQAQAFTESLTILGEAIARDLHWVSPRAIGAHWAVQRSDRHPTEYLNPFWPEKSRRWQQDLLAASSAFGFDVLLGSNLPIEVTDGHKNPAEDCPPNYFEYGDGQVFPGQKEMDHQYATDLSALRWIIAHHGFGAKISNQRESKVDAVVTAIKAARQEYEAQAMQSD